MIATFAAMTDEAGWMQPGESSMGEPVSGEPSMVNRSYLGEKHLAINFILLKNSYSKQWLKGANASLILHEILYVNDILSIFIFCYSRKTKTITSANTNA